MTTLKLKKPLDGLLFSIESKDTNIQAWFGDLWVEFRRYYKGHYEGTCVYRYETPEKGEEFIFEMYRQVVLDEGDDTNVIIGAPDLGFLISHKRIRTGRKSSIHYSPIPQKEFFSQLRERLKEIVEVVTEIDISEDKKANQTITALMREDRDCASRAVGDLLRVLGNGYKITIERE